MTLREQAIKAVKWTSVSAVATTIIELPRLVILARLLSPQDFGLMAMVMVVIGFADVYTDLGISAAIIHRQDATREQLSSLYWLNIFAGGVVFALVWLSIPLITMFFHEPAIVPLLQVVSFAFLITPLGKQFEILLQKELSFDVLARQEVITSLTALLVVILAAVFGLGVWALVWSFAAQVALKTFFLVRIGWIRFKPSWHFRRADLKGFISFGMFQSGERFVNYVNQRFDQILIGRLLGAESLGFYNFAFNLTIQPRLRINPILTKVAFPVFSRVQHNRETLQKGYLKVVGVLTAINAPLLIGLAAVAPVAVPVIFGEKWSHSVVLIQLLCLVNLLRSTCNPIGSLQLAKGRADLGFKWNSALLVMSIPVIYVGGRLGGGVGVAMALLVLQLLLVVPVYVFLVRPLVGGCAPEYARAILKPIAVAGTMGFVVLLFPQLYHAIPSLMGLLVQVGMGVILYFLLLQWFQKKALEEIWSALSS